MIKLSTILAGTAVAMFAQIAVAQAPMSQSGAVPANDPAYIDQSRLNYTNDPYVKARIARAQANSEYRAERKGARAEYKDEVGAARAERREAVKDANTTRASEIRNEPMK
ncbi:hypothetical protein D3C72_243070 [compost metagenome]